MELVEQKTLFNDSFNNYIKRLGKNDYFDKLINYAISNDYIGNATLSEKVNEFQKDMLKFITSKETKSDYDGDIKKIREKRLYDIAYSIDNYLMTLEPYEALNAFINGDKIKLMESALEYYNNYKKELDEKLKKIIKLTKYEYDNSQEYKKGLNALLNKINDRVNSFSDYNMCMNLNIVDASAPLYLHDIYISNLLIESNIISKFDVEARKYIITGFNTTNSDRGSLCKLILINYSLASIYSDHPETLKISDNNRKILKNESVNGYISIEEIEDAISNGPIEFTKEELKYIKLNFLKEITTGQKTVDKGLYMKLI